MRSSTTLVLCILVLVLVDYISAQKPMKFKKYRRRHHKPTTMVPPIAEHLAFNNERPFSPLFGEELQEEMDHEIIKDNSVPITDPCYHKHCGAGKICVINDNGDAECNCIPTCPQESDVRRKVCSNHNDTWGSDCEVYQMRCYCDENNPKCENKELKHIHIEYYGQCREMPECSEEEMSDFPRRMRDWLYNIMRDLADREELSPHYLKMEREAETNLTRRWSNAAIWKWCDLDGHPHDRAVSRHELFPIRAPLMALEHCIAPFLDSCDADSDHIISLKEWAKCLQLNEDDIEDTCESLRDEEE